MCPLTPFRWHLPVLQGVIVDHTLERGEAPPETASACALHAYLPLGVELPVKSIAVPAFGLEVLVLCLGSRALDPRTVRGHVDESTLAVTRHDHLLPVCGLVALSRCLLTATGSVECAHALGVTARGLDDCAGETWCDHSRSHGYRQRSCDHSPSSDCSRSRKRSWRPGRSRRDRAEAVGASRDRGNSGVTVDSRWCSLCDHFARSM